MGRRGRGVGVQGAERLGQRGGAVRVGLVFFGRGVQAEIVQVQHGDRIGRAAQRVGHGVGDGDGAEGRGTFRFRDGEMSGQPAACAAGIGGKSALHRRHRLEMGTSLVAGTHRMNGGERAFVVQPFQRGQGGVEAEKSVQIDRAGRSKFTPVVRAGQADGGTQAVIIVIAMRDNDIQAVRAATQKQHDQRVVRFRCAARPDRDIGEGGHLAFDSIRGPGCGGKGRAGQDLSSGHLFHGFPRVMNAFVAGK